MQRPPRPLAQRVWCLSQLQPVKMLWVLLYVFDVSFDFFFVLDLNNIMFLLKICEFVKVKIVVICFEVDIISIITIINIMSSAHTDISNILFLWLFCKYSNLKMQ